MMSVAHRLVWGSAVIGGLLLASAGRSAAQEKAPAAPPAWKGDLELAYIQTDGNTNTKALLAALKAARSFSFGALSAEGKGIYGTTEVTTVEADGATEIEEVTSDKAWSGQLKYDQNITERFTGYVLERAERNTPKGIEMRYVSQAGLGYAVIKAPKDLLKLEAGAGYLHENPVGQLSDGYPTARAYASYEHSFTDKTRFTQWVEYLPDLEDSENWLISEETAFITNIMGNFALKTSLAVVFDNLPQPEEADLDKSDRLFKTALLFTF